MTVDSTWRRGDELKAQLGAKEEEKKPKKKNKTS